MLKYIGQHIINQIARFNSKVYIVGNLLTSQQDEVAIANDATTISAANVATGILKCTPDGDETWQLDTAANFISGLVLTGNNFCYDFSVINLSTGGANNITLTTNTGLTLVGNMNVHAQDAADDAVSIGSGRFRVRRTSSTAVTVYRIA